MNTVSVLIQSHVSFEACSVFKHALKFIIITIEDLQFKDYD